MILQFGTSRFLQAHVDLFASEARAAGQSVDDIIIVQVSDDPVRARRLPAFASPDGFPVILRGRVDGAVIDRTVRVTSVKEGISARAEWDRLADLFASSVRYVVSNTGDTGYAIRDAERDPRAAAAPHSFCAMLAELLYRRWQAGGAGVTFLPCELVRQNGRVLHDEIVGLACDQQRERAFCAWLSDDCVWADTLVDRIVSAPIDPVGAIAEPYALWAIGRQPRLIMPFAHPDIVLTDDLESFERLKLHILNLGHSWLAAQWLRRGAPAGLTVREALASADYGISLRRLFADEVIPGFAVRGLENQARAYAATTLDRFANPFLDHQLADIAMHHEAKLHKRIGQFVTWVDAAGARVAMPALRSLLADSGVS